jgi:hypothetical protein
VRQVDERLGLLGDRGTAVPQAAEAGDKVQLRLLAVAAFTGRPRGVGVQALDDAAQPGLVGPGLPGRDLGQQALAGGLRLRPAVRLQVRPDGDGVDPGDGSQGVERVPGPQRPAQLAQFPVPDRGGRRAPPGRWRRRRAPAWCPGAPWCPGAREDRDLNGSHAYLFASSPLCR